MQELIIPIPDSIVIRFRTYEQNMNLLKYLPLIPHTTGQMMHYLTYSHYGLSISPSQVYMSCWRQLPQFSTENKPVQTVLNGDINFNLQSSMHTKTN